MKPAIIMPAHGGVQETEPGGVRVSPSCTGSLRGFEGSSSLASTVWWLMPRRRSSRRMTFASGQPEVLLRSVMRNFDGSSRLPVPMELIIGTPRRMAVSIRSSLLRVESMQSAM